MSGWWQRLKAGDQSTVVQAQNVAISSGVTYSDVRHISQDVVRHEIDKFSDTAIETLSQRFDEFILNYFNRQASVSPDGFRAIQYPFMQRALRTAQIEYGSSGNPDTGESLVDLLVKLAEYQPDSFQAICLNEALSVVPKLTKNQLAALTAIFIVSTVRVQGAPLHIHYEHMRKNLAPLSSLLPDDQLSYRHMQFAQVGWINQSVKASFGWVIRENLPGLYTEGIADPGVVPEPLRQLNPPIYARHERHPNRIRLNAATYDEVDSLAQVYPVVAPWVDSLKETMKQTRTAVAEIEKQIIEQIPDLELFIRVWNNSELGRFALTSIGMVIGYTNWKRINVVGVVPDLDSLFPSDGSTP